MLERTRDNLVELASADRRQSTAGGSESRFPAHFEAIRRSVKPSKKLLHGAVDLSYGELFERIDRLSTLFREHGLRVGDRVVVATRNDREVAVLYLAMLYAGLATVVIDPASAPGEARALISAADPAAIFIDVGLADQIAETETWPVSIKTFKLRDNGRGKSVFGRLRRPKSAEPAASADYPAVLDQLAPSTAPLGPIPQSTAGLILFTSGTTSRPKGVELTHRNLYAQFETFVAQYRFTDMSRILNHLPLHHTEGLNQGPAIALFAQATMYRPAAFSVQTLPELLHGIYRERVTHMITVPTALALILRIGEDMDDCFQTDDFAFVGSTAGTLDENLWRAFEERFDVMVVNSYGLTETVSEAIYCGPTPETRRIGTIGKPVDCRARLLDADGNQVAQGEVGELALKGDNVMAGYFRNPEATAEVMRDGWLLTGDLATVDADGFYRIVGRSKNVVIRGGINVYPEDVSRTILAIPGVLDAVTFGMEDAILGERVVSCLTLDGSVELSAEQVIARCRERMSPEKVPSDVHILDQLPRGPGGNVVIGEVKSIVAERYGRNLDRGGLTTEAQVLATAAATFKVPVDCLAPESTHQTTRAWTSLAHVEFILALEETFSVSLTAKDVMSIATLGDAIRIVKGKLDSP